jgi:hypothetical protein
LGKSRGDLNAKIYMIMADDQCALGFILSGGEASDAGNEGVGKVFFGLAVHYI